MVEIGRIEATVTADSRQFVSGMRQAEQATIGVQGQLNSTRASFVSLAGSIGAAVTGLGTIARAATAVTQQLIELQETIALEESIARAFGLARQEYSGLALAIQATGQERDEIRDLLGDLQEVVGLAARGEERELTLLRELGLGAEFAATAVDNLDDAFIEFLHAVNRFDRVEARGVLSQLVGADASRRYIEAASAISTIEQSLARTQGTFAAEESVAELNVFAQTVRETQEALREALVSLLGATGILEQAQDSIQSGVAFVQRLGSAAENLSRTFERITGSSIGEILFAGGAGGAVGAARQLAGGLREQQELRGLERQLEELLAVANRDAERSRELDETLRALVEAERGGQDILISRELLLPILTELNTEIEHASSRGESDEVVAAQRAYYEVLVRLTETSGETADRLAAVAMQEEELAQVRNAAAEAQSRAQAAATAETERLRDLEIEYRKAYLASLDQWFADELSLRREQESNRAQALNRVNEQLVASIQAQAQAIVQAETEAAETQRAFGVFFDEALLAERERAEHQAAQQRLSRVQTLSVAFSNFFAQAQSDLSDLSNAFQSFISSLINSLLSEAAGTLAASLFPAPGRQFGGPVSAGRLYETHGLGQREFFVPAQDGQIVTGPPSITINVASGVTESGLRRFASEEMVPIIDRVVRGSLIDYQSGSRI